MSSNHFDVLIVGAGISGIASACHLQRQCPGKSFALLEGRDSIGGTWDLFRYPGIRSDSDMHTLGFSFKPWNDPKSIADGPAIMKYLHETVAENGLEQHIRYNTRISSAAWSSERAEWSVETDGGESYTGNMLLMCGGYYSYDEGFTPEFEGVSDFQGAVVHPQKWPEDLDYAGKRVVVIGSGATAMTLVPAMAMSGAERVTMVQRSPTYVISMPDHDFIANTLRKILPDSWAYAITRWKNINLQRYAYGRTRTKPEKVKENLLKMVRKNLPDEYVDEHFVPRYNPWDERLCLIPNGDLYDAINSGRADVVTDHIERFTERGLKMQSGQEIEADIIVTATGLNLVVLSDVRLNVDGLDIDMPETIAYKGMMFSDIPNLVQTFGYVNASWTLRADLTAEYSCRLVNRMDELGMRQVTPRLSPEDVDMDVTTWISEEFQPGYMRRKMHLFPKQGDREPWLNTQNYHLDKQMIRNAPLEDGRLTFSNPPGAAAAPDAGAAERAEVPPARREPVAEQAA
ncbi:MAG: NAD(P)/FAD-dependent oxidoreductase [Gammaproteobacteria bacterium AqS3]|nr:NAD(P)/FAD-dependent oxidoreductase [Gammaproteobacteria bacterium AqS3]